MKQETQLHTDSIGKLLIERGKLNAADLDRARRVQQETPERINVILTQLGLVSERDMAEALALYLDLPLVTAADYPTQVILEDHISTKFLKEYRIIPLADTAEGVVLAIADPLDAYAVNAMRLLTGKPVLPRVGVPAEIEAAFERLYGSSKASIENIFEEVTSEEDEGTNEDIERLKDLASEAPVIRMVNLLISRAVEMRASDIHIEPFERKLKVRYRIDGVLREVDAPPSRLRAAVISRVKLMAKLNIAETRLPQDGRIRLVIRGKEIDLRVSTVPSMHGESVVLRVLDKGSVALDFSTLGFDKQVLKSYLDLLDRPHGILLVTGPTGSGKTTTLYTSLLRLNTGERKILTVEDPIEYQLEGINQVQVKPQIGLGFANVLRSFLRQDPDVIMIGEIRDLETAEIAVQAALTGHKVLSTLHTNDAATTITRLLDMGVEDYLLTSTVNGVVAQRLVRTLCGHCREPRPVLPEMVEQLQLGRFTSSDPITLYQATGCEHCNGSGYLGRTGLLELLVLSDPIRRLILRRAEAHEIKRAAAEAGMRTMYQDGMYKILAGTTTLEEVLRVTRDT
ncbi:MAG: type II secretion system ATPase GspE [candidate division NC10 bacterium]